MVLDLGVSNLPTGVFLVVHLSAFAIGATLAVKSFRSARGLFGWAFSLFAVAEVLYLGYHLAYMTFLLSHTLAEVLNLVAFILVFVAAGQSVLRRDPAAQPARA